METMRPSVKPILLLVLKRVVLMLACVVRWPDQSLIETNATVINCTFGAEACRRVRNANHFVWTANGGRAPAGGMGFSRMSRPLPHSAGGAMDEPSSWRRCK